MATLLVTALGSVPGKSMLCAGLAQGLAKRGRRVGYFKPIAVTDARPVAGYEDGDAAFLKRSLALEAEVSDICPAVLGAADLAGGLSPVLSRVKEAFGRASRGKDVMLAEGLSVMPESPQLQATVALADALTARMLLIVPYGVFPSEAMAVLSELGGRVTGVIANLTPQREVEAVKSSWPIWLESVKLLGVVPEDRRLQAPSVSDLAASVGGGLPPGGAAGEELVESLQLGVLTADPVTPYFRSRENKAVVVRSDRPDLQLVALGTSTRCLVLTGEEPPFRDVLYRAKEQGVPLVQAPGDTITVLGKLEEGLKSVRFRQQKKLAVLEQVLDAAVDWEAVAMVAS